MLYSTSFLQKLVSRILFDRRPVSARLKDKIKHGFPNYFENAKLDPNFTQAFTDCTATQRSDISTILASTGKTIKLDVVSIKPEKKYIQNHEHLPGKDHHIVMFPAAFDWYESFGCLTDNSLLAKATGAEVHTFNYPGIHLSATNNKKDKIQEFNDLVNTRISVVNQLLADGIHPDKIILQGDCFGSAVAYAVKKEYENHGIKIRVIAANTFSSFSDTIIDYLKNNANFIVRLILNKPRVKRLLDRTGWYIKLTDSFKSVDPYQMIIQRKQDKFLNKSTLYKKLKKHTQKSQNYNNSCPESFKKSRDELLKSSKIKLTKAEHRKEAIKLGAEKEINQLLAEKIKDSSKRKKITINMIAYYVENNADLNSFLVKKNITLTSEKINKIAHILKSADNSDNLKKVDTHPLSLYQFDGVFDLISDYIKKSNQYIYNNPQDKLSLNNLPKLLKSSTKKERTYQIIVEGILYSLIPAAIFFAIINPVVLPFILTNIGISANTIIPFGLIYKIAIPTITISSVLFAASFISISKYYLGCVISYIKDALLRFRHIPTNNSIIDSAKHKDRAHQQEELSENPVSNASSNQQEYLASTSVMIPELQLYKKQTDLNQNSGSKTDKSTSIRLAVAG